MPIARDGLQHTHAVALGVDERDILSHAGYLHRLAEHFTARIYYLLYRFFYIAHRDNDGRILRGPIGFFREKPTVNRAGLLWTALAGFGSGCKDVIAHIFAKHLRLPAEY